MTPPKLLELNVKAKKERPPERAKVALTEEALMEAIMSLKKMVATQDYGMSWDEYFAKAA